MSKVGKRAFLLLVSLIHILTESEALKWDSNKDEWVKNLRINYIYEGKTVTTNYYKWNAKKRAYVPVSYTHLNPSRKVRKTISKKK